MFVTDFVFLAFSACDLWQWHDIDCNRYKGMYFSSKQGCESAKIFAEKTGFGVDSWLCRCPVDWCCPGRCQPTRQEGVSPSAGGAQGREDPLGESGVLPKVARGGKMHSTLPRP